jgi:glycosyltransferase involved in cell wall biosynthesis
MKIAMIGQKGIPASYGGIERHVEELSTRLVERGHEVTVYSRPYYTRIRGQYRGVNLVTVPSMKTKHFDTATHCAFSMPHVLTQKFDIVHFHALGPSIFASIAQLRGAKTAVTVHGLDWQREKWGRAARWILKKCEYTSIHFPTRTIVVSRSLKDYFRRKYDRAVTYIPNGINLPSVREAKKIRDMGIIPGEYVLFVGRLVPEKGCHYLLDAFRKVNSGLDLVIAGGSSFSTDYTENLRKHANDRVRFLGYVYGDVLDELYSNAKVFVLPSDLEGLPIALLEAMSFGNCCLTSDIPENVEVLGDCGATFSQGNVEDLAQQLSVLLEDPDRRRSLGDCARKHVLDTYDWEGVTLLTESLYDSMLREG